MKEIIATTNAPAAIGPYSQAVKVGDMLYTSGALGIDMATGKLAEGIEAQSHCALKNLGEILKAAGASYENVVKTTVFVQDLGDFATVNGIYSQYFTENFPARSCVEVAKLPLGALVEIESIVAL